MGMVAVVIVKPAGQLAQDRCRRWSFVDLNVVPLESFDEGLGHSIALRTLDRCPTDDEAQLFAKGYRVGGYVARPVVAEPFDGPGGLLNRPEPVLQAGHHQVAHQVPINPPGGGDKAHGFAVTAVQTEGDTDPLAIVAADLETIGASPLVAASNGDSAVVSPLCARRRMALEQQPGPEHRPVDRLVVGSGGAIDTAPTVHQGLNPPVPVGRATIDHRPNISE